MGFIVQCDSCKEMIKGKPQGWRIDSPEWGIQENYVFCEACFRVLAKAISKVIEEIIGGDDGHAVFHQRTTSKKLE